MVDVTNYNDNTIISGTSDNESINNSGENVTINGGKGITAVIR